MDDIKVTRCTILRCPHCEYHCATCNKTFDRPGRGILQELSAYDIAQAHESMTGHEIRKSG